MRRPGEPFGPAALESLVIEYQDSGALPLSKLNSALPLDVTVNEMEQAFVVLAEHGIEVVDDGDVPTPPAAPTSEPHGEAATAFIERVLASEFFLSRLTDAAFADGGHTEAVNTTASAPNETSIISIAYENRETRSCRTDLGVI
jgi:hypothetical protein